MDSNWTVNGPTTGNLQQNEQNGQMVKKMASRPAIQPFSQ